MKTLSTVQMWVLLLALLAGAIVYAYSIRNTIQVSPKAGCSSCPYRNNEDEKAKID